MELAKIRRAVEMAAACEEINYEWRAPDDAKWSARIWGGGNWIIGVGPDAWAAVQAAHALRSMKQRELGY